MSRHSGGAGAPSAGGPAFASAPVFAAELPPAGDREPRRPRPSFCPGNGGGCEGIEAEGANRRTRAVVPGLGHLSCAVEVEGRGGGSGGEGAENADEVPTTVVFLRPRQLWRQRCPSFTQKTPWLSGLRTARTQSGCQEEERRSGGFVERGPLPTHLPQG